MVYSGFSARFSRHDTSGTQTGDHLKFDRFAGAIDTAALAPLGGPSASAAQFVPVLFVMSLHPTYEGFLPIDRASLG